MSNKILFYVSYKVCETGTCFVLQDTITIIHLSTCKSQRALNTHAYMFSLFVISGLVNHEQTQLKKRLDNVVPCNNGVRNDKLCDQDSSR